MENKDFVTTSQVMGEDVEVSNGPPAQALEDLKIGYVVGLTKEGNFVFDVFGKEKGVVELLGIQAYGAFRVQQLYNQSQMSGDALVHEVGKGLAILNQKLDKLLGVPTPKKSDNNI